MNKKEKEFKLFRSSFSSLDQEPLQQHRHLHHHHHIHTSPPLLHHHNRHQHQKAIIINSSSGNSSLKSDSTSSLTSSSSSNSSSRSSSQTAPLNQIKHKSNQFQNSFDYNNNNNKPLSRHVRFNLDKSSLNRNSIEHLHKMKSKLRKNC